MPLFANGNDERDYRICNATFRRLIDRIGLHQRSAGDAAKHAELKLLLGQWESTGGRPAEITTEYLATLELIGHE